MTARDAIIAKVKKCLALAKSANEHEAAIALRQAQRLMAEHGISDLDIEHADIQEVGARAGAAVTPSKWETALAVRTAKAFGCVAYLSIGYPASKWMFTGPGSAPEIAVYAFQVLLRQVKRGRADYIKTRLRRCGSANRTRRADLWCDGWVIAAMALVERFAGSAEQEARIAGYLEHKHNLKPFDARDRNAGRNLTEKDYRDRWVGMDAGRGAELNRGVAGGRSAGLIGGLVE